MRVFQIAFLLVMATQAYASEAPRRSMREAISSVLQESFTYDESRSREELKSENLDTAEEVVSLPTVVVSVQRDDAAKAIQEARRKFEDEKFDWKNGGTILKKKGDRMTSELKFGQNPNGGIEFLKFSW